MSRKERQRKLIEKIESLGQVLGVEDIVIKNVLGDFLVPFLYHRRSLAIDILEKQNGSMFIVEILARKQNEEFLHKFEIPFYKDMTRSEIESHYDGLIEKGFIRAVYLKKQEGLSKAYINLRDKGEIEILKTNSITIQTYNPDPNKDVVQKMKEYGFDINLEENTLESIEKLEKFVNENLA